MYGTVPASRLTSIPSNALVGNSETGGCTLTMVPSPHPWSYGYSVDRPSSATSTSSPTS